MVLAVDGLGNVAVVGDAAESSCFSGSSGGTLNSSGASGALVTEFDSNGHAKYSTVFADGSPGSVAHFDSSGNLYLAGTFTGSLNLGPTLTAPSPNGSTAFVAKLDPSGHVLWQVADGSYSSATGIASGAAGAFVAGTYWGTIGLAQTSSAQGGADLFLAGLGDGGVPTFEKSVRAAGLLIDALAADPTGGVVAAGRLGAYDDLGNGLLAPPGIAIARFDGSGNVVASASFDVDPYTSLGGQQTTLAVDTTGNVVIGTSFFGAGDFGTGVLAGASPDPLSPTIVVARYAPAMADLPSPRAACPVPSDGGRPEGGSLVAAAVNVYGESMALGADTAYWTTGTEVMSAALAGGSATPIAITQNGAGPILLDSNTLYWTNAGNTGPLQEPQANGSVVALGLDGGAATTLASNQSAPGALVVDATKVYYVAGGVTDADGGTSPASIFAVPRSGGMPATVITGLTSQGPLAISSGVLAFATSSGAPGTTSQIATVPVTGGSPTVVATSDHGVTGIAIDATKVYWLDGSTWGTDSVGADGRLLSVPRAGGTPSVLADDQAAPNKLELLASTLFWSTGGSWSNSYAANNAGLWSLPVTSATPTALVAGRSSVATFAVDSAHVAWFDLLDSDSDVLGLFTMHR